MILADCFYNNELATCKDLRALVLWEGAIDETDDALAPSSR